MVNNFKNVVSSLKKELSCESFKDYFLLTSLFILVLSSAFLWVNMLYNNLINSVYFNLESSFRFLFYFFSFSVILYLLMLLEHFLFGIVFSRNFFRDKFTKYLSFSFYFYLIAWTLVVFSSFNNSVSILLVSFLFFTFSLSIAITNYEKNFSLDRFKSVILSFVIFVINFFLVRNIISYVFRTLAF